MTKLKLSSVISEKPVRVTIDLPAVIYRDLATYASIMSDGVGHQAVHPSKLIAPMITQFLKSDKSFNRARKTLPNYKSG